MLWVRSPNDCWSIYCTDQLNLGQDPCMLLWYWLCSEHCKTALSHQTLEV